MASHLQSLKVFWCLKCDTYLHEDRGFTKAEPTDEAVVIMYCPYCTPNRFGGVRGVAWRVYESLCSAWTRATWPLWLALHSVKDEPGAA